MSGPTAEFGWPQEGDFQLDTRSMQAIIPALESDIAASATTDTVGRTCPAVPMRVRISDQAMR